MKTPQEIAQNLSHSVWGMTANIGTSVMPEGFSSQWSDLTPAQKRAVLAELVKRQTLDPRFATRARFSDSGNSVNATHVFEEVLKSAVDARLFHADRTRRFDESPRFMQATAELPTTNL